MAVPTDKDDDGAGAVATVAADGGAMALPEASSVVAHATRDTMRGADILAEAIALASDESDKWAEYAQDLASFRAGGALGATPPAPLRNVELLGLTPAAYVLRALRAVRPTDVDQVLLTLPFADALRLMRFILHALRRGQAVELCTRAALLLLRVHHSQLAASARRIAGGSAGGAFSTAASLAASTSASATSGGAGSAQASLLPLIVSLKAAMQSAVGASRDHVGFNVAGLRFIDRSLADVAEAAEFVGDGAAEPHGPGGAGADEGKGRGKKKAGAAFRVGKRAKVQLL
jgi:hypothetical protein